METTRVGGGATRGKLSTAASAAVKSAALRAKTAAGGASNFDSRKRKRGALQDISNNNSSARSGSSVGGKKTGACSAVVKPVVKRSVASASIITSNVSANVTVRGRVGKPTAHTVAGGTTKRRRQEVQTSLLSFQSVTSKATKSIKTESESTETETETEAALEAIKEEPMTTQSDTQATQEMTQEVEMIECHETLEKSEEETESVSVSAPAKTIHVPTITTTQSTEEVPLYQPRPYVFKFDHTDSGFDETTYATQVTDIDAAFQDSAVHCVRIVRDMDRFHKQHETKYHAEPTYIGDVQLDINEKMRAILVDWLVEVGEEYELDSQTFHKTVNLVDRCLAKFKINRKQFQLLGCACMMIAAKFEEVYGPNVDEFVYISDQTYTSDEMLEMEAKVLQALEYRIASTTCHGFLPRFCRAGCTSEKQKALVHYLCDFAILHYSMLHYRPSQLAAAAVYLSRLMTNEEQPWTPTLHHYTEFNAWDLEACVMELYRLHRTENEIVLTQRDKAKAVSEKYVADKFHGVSAIPSMNEAALERSFLAYELPSYSTKKPVETLDTSSSGDTE